MAALRAVILTYSLKNGESIPLFISHIRAAHGRAGSYHSVLFIDGNLVGFMPHRSNAGRYPSDTPPLAAGPLQGREPDMQLG
jgi:hypothetical protein